MVAAVATQFLCAITSLMSFSLLSLEFCAPGCQTDINAKIGVDLLATAIG
jgi:hypothetical protein|tara:strand:- start:2032 stop:2181 length:150 start_codon:yes stop_codon:yes gene_type:complete